MTTYICEGCGQWSNAEARVQELEREVAELKGVVKLRGVHPSTCPKGIGIGYYKPPANAVCNCGIDPVLSCAKCGRWGRSIICGYCGHERDSGIKPLDARST